ncbi:hypothetical protein Tco_0109226 [Tanacetum coccineum]
MLLAMKDEAKSNLKDEENDFMLDNSYGGETLEELTVAAVSEVNASNKVHEQVNHAKRKPIIHTSYDDKIDSNIIFNDLYVENNGGTSEHDSNAHDEYHNIQMPTFYKTDVIPMSASLSKNLQELKGELIEEVQEILNIFESMEQKKNELLNAELAKSSSDSKDIQANLLKRIKILEYDSKRSQAQSIDFELKLQHQKDKMACDVSWKSKMSIINDENVLLKTQVDFVVKER